MRAEAIRVEDGIPLPKPKRHAGRKYPLDTMSIGQSFTAPKAKLASLRVCICREQKATSKRFSYRTIASGRIRIWRTA
jgi:hypothetical protein